MLVLSFDVSTKCGIALWQDNKIIKSWTHHVKRNADMSERIYSFSQYLLKLQSRYNPDLVLFEGLYFNKNHKSFHFIHMKVQLYMEAQIRNVFHGKCVQIHTNIAYKTIPKSYRNYWKSKVPLHLVTKGPRKDQYIKLSSREKKKWITTQYVRENIFADVKNDDEADAILLTQTDFLEYRKKNQEKWGK